MILLCQLLSENKTYLSDRNYFNCVKRENGVMRDDSKEKFKEIF
jgi:hypothetical protein